MHELTSSITAVTVFRQGAQVERSAPVPEGIDGAVRIMGLPLVLLDDSVAIRIEGPEPRSVVMDYRIALHVSGATEVGDLQQRLQAARQERDRWSLRQQTLYSLRAQLQILETSTRPQTPSGAPVGTYQLTARQGSTSPMGRRRP